MTPLIVGQIIENPLHGERIRFLKTAPETNGELVQYESWMAPGGTVGVAHVHPIQTSHFLVVSGRASFRVEGADIELGPGEQLTVPPRTPHRLWNSGDVEAHLIVEFWSGLLKQEFFGNLERTKQPYKRIVIDSLTALKMFSMQGEDSRIMIQSFLRFLSELEATCLLVSERLKPAVIETEFFLARGEIRFHKWLDGNVIRRAISIEKYRGSRFDDRIRPITITNAGITVDSQGSVSLTAGRLAKLGDAYLEQRIGDEVSTVIERVMKLIEEANKMRVSASDVEHGISRAMLHLHRKNYQKALKTALNAQSVLRERLDRAKQGLPPPPPRAVPPPPGVRK